MLSTSRCIAPRTNANWSDDCPRSAWANPSRATKTSMKRRMAGSGLICVAAKEVGLAQVHSPWIGKTRKRLRSLWPAGMVSPLRNLPAVHNVIRSAVGDHHLVPGSLSHRGSWELEQSGVAEAVRALWHAKWQGG